MLGTGFAKIGSETLAIDASARRPHDTDGSVRSLARNEFLFEAGDIKSNVYRVEAGALCIYRTRPGLTIEIIEHALAGDIVGMGFLERHAFNARATVETSVSCFPLEAVDQLVENDAHAKARFDDSVEREFIFRRESLVSSAREQPMGRRCWRWCSPRPIRSRKWPVPRVRLPLLLQSPRPSKSRCCR